jgi:hypothetical protein
MYADAKGLIWRYMHEFHAKYPVEFVPPLVIPVPVPAWKQESRQLTPAEIEELV